MSNEEEYFEYPSYFIGSCPVNGEATPYHCPHEQEEHGWGSCDIEDCPCENGWEE